MKHLIQELVAVIPPRSPSARSLDKLSFLKRAVWCLRSRRGEAGGCLCGALFLSGWSWL